MPWWSQQCLKLIPRSTGHRGSSNCIHFECFLGSRGLNSWVLLELQQRIVELSWILFQVDGRSEVGSASLAIELLHNVSPASTQKIIKSLLESGFRLLCSLPIHIPQCQVRLNPYPIELQFAPSAKVDCVLISPRKIQVNQSPAQGAR